jgi:triosephosphate isomerase
MSKNRKYLIAGNWKMNVSSSDAVRLVSEIIGEIDYVPKVDILVCPPFTSIQAARSALDGRCPIFLGAQNFYPEKNGAFTGEISAVMLRELGVSHVIVGHSERRANFNDSDDFVNKKVKCAMANSLIPILCVGETADQRKKGKALDVVRAQVESGLNGISQGESGKFVVAYEPVWAIGTGETATPKIAQEMHAFIRGLLENLFDSEYASAVKILYGGSMKPDNAEELLNESDIDGGLIGGASLNYRAFAEIVKTSHGMSD